MNIKNIVIKKRVLISNKEFINSRFKLENDRTMDDFTKNILFTAHKLFNGDFSSLNSDSSGIVLTTRTGPYNSIKSVADIINNYDYKGINPSLFPNVMLSTSLAYLTIYLNVHGPSCTFYDTDRNGRNALDYSIVQIKAGNCDAMIDIYTDENNWAEGKYITRKDFYM